MLISLLLIIAWSHIAYLICHNINRWDIISHKDFFLTIILAIFFTIVIVTCDLSIIYKLLLSILAYIVTVWSLEEC